MDKFEQHITNNKHLFDDKVPDRDKMWQAIESELSSENEEVKTRTIWQSSWFRIAASVLLLLCCSAAFLVSGEQSNKMAVNQELDDINHYYTAIVSSQVAKLKNNENLSENDKEEFLSYLEELDNEHKELTKEMHQNLDNNIILQAIISNYRKRIELIENFLVKINEANIIQGNNGHIL